MFISIKVIKEIHQLTGKTTLCSSSHCKNQNLMKSILFKKGSQSVKGMNAWQPLFFILAYLAFVMQCEMGRYN